MRKLAVLLKKEFLQIFRDKFIVRSMLLLPMFQLLVLPLAANYDIKNFRMAAIDRDHTQFSRRLLTELQAGGYFSLTESVASWTQAERMIERGDVDMIVEIPADFERDIVLGRSPEVSVHISAINGLSAGVAASYLGSITGDFAASLASEGAISASLSEVAGKYPVRVRVATQEWYNPKFDYKTVIVPGILALLITIAGMSMMALSAVKEKERGTIEQLNVTPMSRTMYMFAKTIPFFIIGLVQFTIGLAMARVVYDIPMVGSLGVLYGIISLYLVGLVFLGFMIANLSETQVQSIFLSFFRDDGADSDERSVYAGGEYAGLGAAGGCGQSCGTYHFVDQDGDGQGEFVGGSGAALVGIGAFHGRDGAFGRSDVPQAQSVGSLCVEPLLWLVFNLYL